MTQSYSLPRAAILLLLEAQSNEVEEEWDLAAENQWDMTNREETQLRVL